MRRLTDDDAAKLPDTALGRTASGAGRAGEGSRQRRAEAERPRRGPAFDGWRAPNDPLLWFYPDASRILELSTKCDPAEALQVAAEARAFLAGRGVNLFGEQETKTRTALEFFAREAREPAVASD